jgi:hypothetical protein
VNLENYGDGWVPDISNITRPFKILWSIDAHYRGINPYEQIFVKGRYDILAHATKDYVQAPYHRWLANCSDASLLQPIKDCPKVHKLGFCGNRGTSQRQQILDSLTEMFGLKQDIFVIGNSMVRSINSYHVHFNINISNDINYRSFETLACQTVLLTNYNPQYDDLGFVNAHNCFIYKDEKDLLDKTRQLLDMINDPTKPLDTVAMNGRQLFLDRHTFDHRAKEILSFVEMRR